MGFHWGVLVIPKHPYTVNLPQQLQAGESCVDQWFSYPSVVTGCGAARAAWWLAQDREPPANLSDQIGTFSKAQSDTLGGNRRIISISHQR